MKENTTAVTPDQAIFTATYWLWMGLSGVVVIPIVFGINDAGQSPVRWAVVGGVLVLYFLLVSWRIALSGRARDASMKPEKPDFDAGAFWRWFTVSLVGWAVVLGIREILDGVPLAAVSSSASVFYSMMVAQRMVTGVSIRRQMRWRNRRWAGKAVEP